MDKSTKRPDMIGNKFGVGNKGGRPRKFQDPAAFDRMVDEFFNMCEETGKKPTIEHLAVYMGTNDETLHDYSEIKEYSGSYKKAKERCLNWLISNGLEARNPAMHIFLAKNNYGYKDKHEIDNNLSGGVTIKWEE
jgi:hypothetical protein